MAQILSFIPVKLLKRILLTFIQETIDHFYQDCTTQNMNWTHPCNSFTHLHSKPFDVTQQNT